MCLPVEPKRLEGLDPTTDGFVIEEQGAVLPDLQAKAMPERYQLMILLAAWCGLRFGEITELRRKDICPVSPV